MARQHAVAGAKPQGNGAGQRLQAEGPEQVDDHPHPLQHIEPEHGQRPQQPIVDQDLHRIHLDDVPLAAPADAHQSGNGQRLAELRQRLIQIGGAAAEDDGLGVGDLDIAGGGGKGFPDGGDGAGLADQHHQAKHRQHNGQNGQQPQPRCPAAGAEAPEQAVARQNSQRHAGRQKRRLGADDQKRHEAKPRGDRLQPAGPAGGALLPAHPARQHHRQQKHHDGGNVVACIEKAPAAPIAQGICIGEEAHAQNIGDQHAQPQHQQRKAQHLIHPALAGGAVAALEHGEIDHQHQKAIAEADDILHIGAQTELRPAEMLIGHRPAPGDADGGKHPHGPPVAAQQHIDRHHQQKGHPQQKAGAHARDVLDIQTAEHPAVAAAAEIGPDAVDHIQKRAGQKQQPERPFT